MKAHFYIVFKKKPASGTLQVIKVEEPEQRFTLTGLKLKDEACTPHSESLNTHKTKPTGKLSQEVKGLKAEIH